MGDLGKVPVAYVQEAKKLLDDRPPIGFSGDSLSIVVTQYEAGSPRAITLYTFHEDFVHVYHPGFTLNAYSTVFVPGTPRRHTTSITPSLWGTDSRSSAQMPLQRVSRGAYN